MNATEKAFSKINMCKSDAATQDNWNVVPLMINWKEAAHSIFYKITYSEKAECGLDIVDYISDDEAFRMFENNKTVADYVNAAIANKNAA